jgi:hypothetical protein
VRQRRFANEECMTRDEIPDAAAAAAFWRLVDHLRHRSDAQNVDMMGLAGFCRNCLSDWLQEAAETSGSPIEKSTARTLVYGMDYEDWKRVHQAPASPEQLARMEASVARNRR